MKNKYLLPLLVIPMFFMGHKNAKAQNQTVNTPLDGVGLPGTTELRTAVANAGAGDTIFFAPITNNSPIVLNSGEILIDKPLVFVGNGGTTTSISGNGQRIFNVQSADSLIILGLGFTAGADSIGAGIWANETRLFLDDCAFNANIADSTGGAIHFTSITGLDFVVENSTFTGNSALGNAATLGGGAIYNQGGNLYVAQTTFDGNSATGTSGSGGAIFLASGASFVADTNTYANNIAQRAGGAIEDRSGGITTAVLTGNTFTANTAGNNPGNGGAIHISSDGNMMIQGGEFTGNLAAREGGALWNSVGNMTISEVNIIGNIASGVAADDGGGGVFNNGGLLVIQNNTVIDGNTANGTAGSGGGVFNHTGGQLSIVNAIITNNTAARAGGGIEDNSGTADIITLIDVVLDTNTASAAPGNGGGLHITGPGNIAITNGTVRGNIAAAEGGGLWNGAGTMTIDGTAIVGNTASGADADQGGGGIYNLSGVVDITNATINNNVADGLAGSGGGILNDNGATLTVTSSTILGNSSVRAGGGIEDNSKAGTMVTLTMVNLDSNVTSMAPGNGGGLHITGDGDVTITGGQVQGNIASAEGGGLWNGAGIMIVDGTRIIGNTASGADANQGGGGIYNLSGTVTVQNAAVIANNVADGTAGSGGGILNDVGGTLNVTASAISNNDAVRAGGGIEDVSGAATTVTILNSTLTGNTTEASPGNGGALHVTGDGNVDITSSFVLNNSASAEGGGLWNGAGTMSIDGTTISGNTASGAGSDQGGGGIYNLSGIVNITNNTVISNNIADGAAGSGGGILNDVGGMVTITSSQINNNSAVRAGGGIEDNSGDATTISISNSSLAGNTTAASPGNGGAVHITGAGNLTITGGNVTGNTAASEGGGLWNGTGTMLIEGTRIDSNIASGNDATNGGGGLFNLRGIMSVSNALIVANVADGTAGSGGGIFNDSAATLTVRNTQILANTAVRAGGGIEDNSRIDTELLIVDSKLDSNRVAMAPGNGGGLHITGNGNVTILGGTVNGNYASAEGGGLWNGAGSMLVNNVVLDGNEAEGNGADQGGGAIYNLSGTLTVLKSTISNNSATGTAGSGGGILTDVGTVLNVDSTVFISNTSNRAGGAIEDNSGATTIMVINGSDFTDNTTGSAPGNGGAIHITGPGNADITGGTYENNAASREGGAVWNGSGIMNITGAYFTGNTADGPAVDDGGGALFNNGGTLTVTRSTLANNGALTQMGTGGGIHNNAGTLIVAYATISGNQTNNLGGGIFNNGTATLNAVTLTKNLSTLDGGGVAQIDAASTFTLSGTILAGNTAVANGDDFRVIGGSITSNGYNLVGLDDDGLISAMGTDFVGTTASPIDPQLDVLADNGGGMLTHAILCGSDALDNGDPSNTDFDQIGQAVFGTSRDIGAYEKQDICTSIFERNNATKIASIYPNPSTGSVLNITIPTVVENGTYHILEMASGKTLATGKLVSGENTLNLSSFTAGMYSIQILINNSSETHRLVKVK